MKFNQDVAILNSILLHFKERTEIKELAERKVTKDSVSILIGVDSQKFTITVLQESNYK